MNAAEKSVENEAAALSRRKKVVEMIITTVVGIEDRLVVGRGVKRKPIVQRS